MNIPIANIHPRSWPKSLISGILAVVWMLFIYHTTVMTFNTNDDIGRSMRVHGYGYFVAGSPFILYSNFIWGWILSALPKIGWMYPYYWMTIVVLVVITWAFIYYLWQRLPWYVAVSMAFSAVTYAMIAPQFTINAGLLAVAMLLALRNFRHSARPIDLYFAIIFGVLALLIRERQFLLTSIVGLAFVPIRHLWHSATARRAGALLLILCVSIVGVDRIVHATDPTYVRINQLRSAYDPIEDYQALRYLKQNRDIVAQSGFSWNDLVMISRYFWYNSDYTEIDRLTNLNAHINPFSYMTMNLNTGWQAVSTLQEGIYLSFLITITMFSLLQKKPYLLIGTCIALAMIWGFGFIGRGAMMRVTLPIITLIFVVAITELPWKYVQRRSSIFLLSTACFITMLMQTHIVIQQQGIHSKKREELNQISTKIDFNKTFFTGFAIPATYMYPVNIYPAQFDTKNIVVFNLSIIEPYNTYSETMRDFDGEFTSEAGVHIAATQNELKILQEHCWAKFGGILTTTEYLNTESLMIYVARCANSPLPHRNNVYLSYGAIR